MKRHNLKTHFNLRDISYDDIVMIIKNMPLTFYPAIFIELIETSLSRGVWTKGGLVRIAKKLDDVFWSKK